MSIDELPVEILVSVFRVLRDMHVYTRSHRWLFVTHVCRDWRYAALDNAELWTQIYSLDTNCVQAFLIRSKNAPLDIYYPLVNGTPLRLDTILSIILLESSRFRRVELARVMAAHSLLMHPFPSGAPLLIHLDLDYFFLRQARPPPGPVLQSLTELADVTLRISEHGLPALRRLRLNHWPVAPIASLRGLVNPSFRSLVIIQPHTRHSASTWARFLTELPLLEELTLASAFPLITGDAAPATPGLIPVIHLPHLSSLRLREDESTHQLSLMQHIEASSVHITFSSHDSGGLVPFKQFTNIIHTLSQKFRREHYKMPICPASLHIQLIVNNIAGEDTLLNLVVALYPALDDTDRSYCLNLSPDSSTSPIFELATGMHAPHHSVYPPLCDMLRTTFSWSTLRKLCLGSLYISAPVDNTWELLTFRNLFLHMTKLRVLVISSGNHRFFTRLAAVDPHSAEPGTNQGTGSVARVLFPLLEILVIKDCLTLGDTNYKSLSRILVSRKTAGYPMLKVHICLSARYDSRLDQRDAFVAQKIAVAPLVSVGCPVDICAENGGDWYITALQNEV